MGNIIKAIFEDGDELIFDAEPLVFLDSDIEDVKFQKRRERNVLVKDFQKKNTFFYG